MEKLLMSQEKFDHMLRLSDEQQVIAALAINDQRDCPQTASGCGGRWR